MPLHKSTRGPRLDPTMISAPLGDFRHTMHIGRGGDAFGDTSFLSSHGPSPPSADLEASGEPPTTVPDEPLNHSDCGNHSDSAVDGLGVSSRNSELQHSESVSSFTLDLDLDLGPSILGDVLGVMDGLGLDSDWTMPNDEEVFTPIKGGASPVKPEHLTATEEAVSVKNELNEKQRDADDAGERGEVCIMEGNGIKSKGLKPKVRFSDKREEIIRQASEEEGQGFEFQDEEGPESVSATAVDEEKGHDPAVVNDTDAANHKSDLPPSPASSHSSEYEGVTPLDRRRQENCHSETDSEEEEEEEEGGENGRGYTFEDEFDDEIGL